MPLKVTVTVGGVKHCFPESTMSIDAHGNLVIRSKSCATVFPAHAYNMAEEREIPLQSGGHGG